MLLAVANWVAEYVRARAKILVLTFFTYAALC